MPITQKTNTGYPFMTPEEYCQDKTAKSGSSFYYSFMFLPQSQRKAIIALYAFCREVDDIADAQSNPQIKKVKLQWWRDEIQRLFDNQPQHPVSRALRPIIERFDLPQEYFLEIIDGMEMDLTHNRYADFKSLSLYCYRVAGVVGLMAAEIFGYRDRQTLKYARDLGTAFQLTNILRDVYEDARRDRIYLPQEDLVQFNVSEDDIIQGRNSDNFTRLMQFEVARTRDYYQRAFSHLPQQDRYAQRCGLIMANIYQAVLDEIEADDFRVLEHRTALTPLRKIWIAITTLFNERRLQRRWLKQQHA